jgi:uncharacterized protein involved in exopolysaccharide biosynthesis
MNMLPTTPTANGVLPADRGLTAYQELWKLIRRHKLRILLGVVLGLALGTLACALGGPWYDSNAQMLVIKKRFDTAPITGPDQNRAHEDYLSTHMLLIASRRVILHAVEKGELDTLEQFRDKRGLRREVTDWVRQTLFEAEPEGRRDEQLATEIIEALVISRDAQKPGFSPSNEIINLSFRGKVAADCPKVLNAIIASYQDFLTETYRNTNAETLELIAQARGMVQKELEVKEAAYQKFLAEAPPLSKGPDRGTAHQDRVFKLDAKLAALRLRRAEIDASIAMIAQAIDRGRNPASIVERLSSFPGSGGFSGANANPNADPLFADHGPKVALVDQFINLQLQRAKLLAVRAPNHPDVVALDRQIDGVRRVFLPTSSSPSAPPVAAAKEINIGSLKIELLKQERDDLKVAEDALAKLFVTEQKGMSASYMYEIQDEAHRKGIERDRLLYEGILTRLKETSSVKDFGGYNTQVIGPALRGNLAVKKYLLIFGLCLFCAVFGGFAWASVTEMAARKSSTPMPTTAAGAEQAGKYEKFMVTEQRGTQS